VSRRTRKKSVGILKEYKLNVRFLTFTGMALIGSLTLSGCGGGGSSSSPSNLVSFWPGNGNYDDVAGGNNGTPFGGVTFAAGENGQAFSFNGTTGRVAVPDSPSLELTHSLAITAWIKIAGYSSPHGDILMRGDDRSGFDPYKMYVTSTGALTFAVGNAAGTEVDLTSTSNIPLNTWTFVSGSIDDATGVMSVYINGVLSGTTTTTVRPFAALDPTENPGLGIGNVQSGNYSFYFNGLIEEVKLYNSAAPAAAVPTP